MKKKKSKSAWADSHFEIVGVSKSQAKKIKAALIEAAAKKGV